MGHTLWTLLILGLYPHCLSVRLSVCVPVVYLHCTLLQCPHSLTAARPHPHLHVHEWVEDGRREDHSGCAPCAVVVGGQRQCESEDASAVQPLAHEDHSEQLPDVVAVRDQVHPSGRVAHQVLEL